MIQCFIRNPRSLSRSDWMRPQSGSPLVGTEAIRRLGNRGPVGALAFILASRLPRRPLGDLILTQHRCRSSLGQNKQMSVPIRNGPARGSIVICTSRSKRWLDRLARAFSRSPCRRRACRRRFYVQDWKRELQAGFEGLRQVKAATARQTVRHAGWTTEIIGTGCPQQGQGSLRRPRLPGDLSGSGG